MYSILTIYRCNLKFSGNFRIKLRTSNNVLSALPINLGLFRLHKEFPNIPGLENTELGLRKEFTVQKRKFLQIFHD